LTKFKQSIEMPGEISDLSERNETDETILETLNSRPFASVRQIARMILVPLTSIYRHLTQSIHFVSMKFRWVPHKRSEAENRIRVEKSAAFLRLSACLNRHQEPKIISWMKPDFICPPIMNNHTPPRTVIGQQKSEK
jgi:hypothetical protein